MADEKPSIHIGFDVAELTVISLKPGDVLAVKLISDDFDENHALSLQEHLSRIFVNNKVMIFTMPNKSDIVFEAIKPVPTEADCSSPASYCSDCNCGKKDQADPGAPKPFKGA